MPSFAPGYVVYYPMLSEVARKNGYALTVHGSLIMDFDLVAIPWTEEACSAEELMKAFAKYAGTCMDIKDSSGEPLSTPAYKPHGRLAWAIPLDNGAVLDLSIMPKPKD